MGFFSDINKKRKKITKKLTPKFLRKAISKIGDFGMKVVGEVGKVVNKLGPIGMMALTVIAPYAAAAMVNMGGIIGAMGTAMQTVGSAMSTIMKAPGKLLGEVAGSALNAAGEAVGGGFQTVTDKMVSALGTQGTSLSDGISKVLGDVKTSLGDITTDSSKLFDAAVDKIADPTMALPKATENLVSPEAGHGLLDKVMKPSIDFKPAGLGVESRSLLEQTQDKLFDVVPDQMQNIDDTLRGQTTQSLGEVGKKLLEGSNSLLAPQAQVPTQPELTMNPLPNASGLGRRGAFKAQNKADFIGQEDTGTLTSEQLRARQMMMFNRGI